MTPFATMLAGGDRRSIGAADRVATLVHETPARFRELWECLRHPDPLVRMRAADTAEKVTRAAPGLLGAVRDDLLGWLLDDGTKEVRWHLVMLAERLPLTHEEATALLRRYETLVATDRSRIVQAEALDAATRLARRFPDMALRVRALIDAAEHAPAPALRARARRCAFLLKGNR